MNAASHRWSPWMEKAMCLIFKKFAKSDKLSLAGLTWLQWLGLGFYWPNRRSKIVLRLTRHVGLGVDEVKRKLFAAAGTSPGKTGKTGKSEPKSLDLSKEEEGTPAAPAKSAAAAAAAEARQGFGEPRQSQQEASQATAKTASDVPKTSWGLSKLRAPKPHPKTQKIEGIKSPLANGNVKHEEIYGCQPSPFRSQASAVWRSSKAGDPPTKTKTASWCVVSGRRTSRTFNLRPEQNDNNLSLIKSVRFVSLVLSSGPSSSSPC